MSEKDDFEAKKREADSDDDLDDDEDDEVESQPEPAPKKVVNQGGKRPVAASAAAPSASVPTSRVGLFVILALAAGGAAGWFGHIQQAKAAASKVDAAAPVGSNAAASGPCGSWQTQICGGSGKESAACQQAKSAAELLTPSTCQAALAVVPATLTRIKAARASCDKLVAKLCSDLAPGSETCTMVKEKTPSFPPQRCDEMMKHYDEVIGQLRQIDAQGGPGGPAGPGGPHGPGGPGGPGAHPPH